MGPACQPLTALPPDHNTGDGFDDDDGDGDDDYMKGFMITIIILKMTCSLSVRCHVCWSPDTDSLGSTCH